MEIRCRGDFDEAVGISLLFRIQNDMTVESLRHLIQEIGQFADQLVDAKVKEVVEHIKQFPEELK